MIHMILYLPQDSQPVYTFTSDECDYHFLWMTQAACPINSQTPAPSGSCTVVNPVTGMAMQ